MTKRWSPERGGDVALNVNPSRTWSLQGCTLAASDGTMLQLCWRGGVCSAAHQLALAGDAQLHEEAAAEGGARLCVVGDEVAGACLPQLRRMPASSSSSIIRL